MHDKELLRKLLKKNRKAQRIFFDKFYTYLFSVAIRYKEDYQKAEEIVSTAFNKAFENIGKFEYRGEQSLKKWLLTIIINESLRKERKHIEIVFAESLPGSYDVESNEELEEFKGYPIAKILQAIDRLPKGYKTVLLMHCVDGLSHSEIATSLSISRNTSKSQVRKARQLLIKKLEDETRKV